VNLAPWSRLASLYRMSTSFWNSSLKEKYVLKLARFYPDDFLQEETVVSLSIMGITVQDAVNPIPYPVLSSATQRGLVIHFVLLTSVYVYSLDI